MKPLSYLLQQGPRNSLLDMFQAVRQALSLVKALKLACHIPTDSSRKKTMSPNQFGQFITHTQSIREISMVLATHIPCLFMTTNQGCQMTEDTIGGSLSHCESNAAL